MKHDTSRRLTKKEKEEIISLFKSDRSLSLRKIGLKVGTSHDTVASVLREVGLIQPAKSPFVSSDKREKVVELYKKLKSSRKVAKKIGCSKSTILAILKENSVTAVDHRVLNNEEFILRSKERYGDKFDYTKTEYIRIKDKVVIGCPIHDFVEVNAESHLRTLDGCPICNEIAVAKAYKERDIWNKISFDEFVNISNKNYNSKYSYSEEDWNGMDNSFRYICPKHGHVKQNARVHYYGHGEGCNDCSIEERSRKRTTSFNEFLELANTVHNFAYTYSNEKYKNMTSSITIKCKNPNHEPFTLSCQKHIHDRQGCYECKGFRLYKNEKVISEAKELHNNFYSYDKTDVIDSKTPILITCPVHGDFLQLVSNHLKGQGCKECGFLKGGSDGLNRFRNDPERADSPCELYLVDVLGFFKIGMAINVYSRDSLFGEVYFHRSENRASVWCVEQKILIESKYAEVKNLPEELIGWNGYQELREPDYFEVDQLSEYMNNQLDYCLKIGWKEYAKENFIIENVY